MNKKKKKERTERKGGGVRSKITAQFKHDAAAAQRVWCTVRVVLFLPSDIRKTSRKKNLCCRGHSGRRRRADPE
jgi:hypothetical protein